MLFEWIGTIPAKYQPLREDSDDKSHSFSYNVFPRYAKWDIPFKTVKVKLIYESQSVMMN